MKTADISVQYVDHMGTDLSVVNAARVSFDKESDWEYLREIDADGEQVKCLSERDNKLIKYLASHNHISPFHHTFITLRVKAPIFVARQLVKHKFMPWNEVSRRYVDNEPEFYMPEFRKKADNVKQGSSEDIIKTGWWRAADNWYSPTERMQEHLKESLILYEDMLIAGVAPEIARCALPQNSMTEWSWSGTLSAWASMLKLRLSEYTQYETRLVAEKCRDIIQPLFPVSLPALLESNV